MRTPNTNGEYDRKNELKAFDETKAGVKGLVDGGATAIPRIFIHPPQNFHDTSNKSGSSRPPGFTIPVIDLDGAHRDPDERKKIVNQILTASRTWGFFQVVNHGIAMSVMEEMLKGVGRFHEQETEAKKEFYSRDYRKKIVYNSNFDLFSSPAACWRDTFTCNMAPHPPLPEELPSLCMEIMCEYSKQVMELGISLFKLISEALGLDPNHLIDLECAQMLTVLGHYYPTCPEPELTMGATRHTDYSFLTILLQDMKQGGLQVLHQNEWHHVPPLPGALVVNIGDLLQLISNDKLRSAEHRVLARRCRARVSVACFFGRDTLGVNSRVYGPIQELLSEEEPPKYPPTTIQEYTTFVRRRGVDGTSALQAFKLSIKNM